jgi:hypothetical protein
LSQHASNLRLAIALGVASFTVWCAYVLIRVLEIG